MENFVFPDEIKTTFIKIYELINTFPILTGIPQKAAKGHFYLHWKIVKKAFTFCTATRREMHKSKKAQHVDLLTSTC